MDLLSALEHEDEDGLTMNQLRDCSVLGDLAWFEGKPAVNEDWASPFHPLIASGASRLCILAPSGLRTLIGPAHGAYATLAQVPRYDPVPGPQLARPKLPYLGRSLRWVAQRRNAQPPQSWLRGGFLTNSSRDLPRTGDVEVRPARLKRLP